MPREEAGIEPMFMPTKLFTPDLHHTRSPPPRARLIINPKQTESSLLSPCSNPIAQPSRFHPSFMIHLLLVSCSTAPMLSGPLPKDVNLTRPYSLTNPIPTPSCIIPSLVSQMQPQTQNMAATAIRQPSKHRSIHPPHVRTRPFPPLLFLLLLSNLLHLQAPRSLLLPRQPRILFRSPRRRPCLPIFRFLRLVHILLPLGLLGLLDPFLFKRIGFGARSFSVLAVLKFAVLQCQFLSHKGRLSSEFSFFLYDLVALGYADPIVKTKVESSFLTFAEKEKWFAFGCSIGGCWLGGRIVRGFWRC